MAHQPEAKLVKKLQGRIAARGGVCFKIVGGESVFQAVGIPDLLCGVYGFFVGIEVKLPGEPLRAMQKVALREIFHAGSVAAVVETVGQGEALLSYLHEWRTGEVTYRGELDRGFLFYRGATSHSWREIN